MAASEKSEAKPRNWAPSDREAAAPVISEIAARPFSIVTFGSLRSLRFAIRRRQRTRFHRGCQSNRPSVQK